MKSTETKSMVLLHHHLKALRLPTMGAECEKVATQAAADKRRPPRLPAPAHRAGAVGTREKGSRASAEGGPVPDHEVLGELDFTARPSVNKMLVAELARCEFIDKHENVLLVGNPAPGNPTWPPRWLPQRVPRATRCASSGPPELVTTLNRGQGRAQLPPTQGPAGQAGPARARRARYVPASKVGAELLFDVISTAYERTSMIVTTNLPFESWTEVLGSERLTGATLDRLTHRCRIIETRARVTGSTTPKPGADGQGRPPLWTKLSRPSSF